MGVSSSTLTEGTSTTFNGPGLGDIPESCIACVFTYLTPPEICSLAQLNRAFRGVASSDTVWETKLPLNYRDLLHLMPRERYQNLCKKDVFALLSRPVPFDDGNKASVSSSLLFVHLILILLLSFCDLLLSYLCLLPAGMRSILNLSLVCNLKWIGSFDFRVSGGA